MVDENGLLYSRAYEPAKIISELSVANLSAIPFGEHGLFTDSIADEIASVVDLTLPVHAWSIKVSQVTTYLLESADGTRVLIDIYMSNIISTSVLAKPSGGGSLIVTYSDSDSNYATHSPAEIYEAFQSGKTVLFYFNGLLLQLFIPTDHLAVFSSTASKGGSTVNSTITIDENSLIDYSDVDSYLNPVPPQDSMILNSSTDGSTKQFQITVDDNGTITATEVQ